MSEREIFRRREGERERQRDGAYVKVSHAIEGVMEESHAIKGGKGDRSSTCKTTRPIKRQQNRKYIVRAV